MTGYAANVWSTVIIQHKAHYDSFRLKHVQHRRIAFNDERADLLRRLVSERRRVEEHTLSWDSPARFLSWTRLAKRDFHMLRLGGHRYTSYLLAQNEH